MMLHRALAVCTILFATATASAQPDDPEASRLKDSANYYWRRDLQKTLSFADQAAAKMSQQQSATMSEELYLIRFRSCRYFFRLREARQYVDAFTSFVESSKDLLGDDYSRQLEQSRLWLAEYYLDVGNYQASLELFTTSVTALERLPPSIQTYQSLYRAMHAMAAIQDVRGEYEAAINQFLASRRYGEYIDRALELPQHVRDYDDMLIYRNVANVLLNKREFGRARSYLDMALHNLESITEQQLIQQGTSTPIVLLETVAAYYRNVNQYDSALLALRRTFPLLDHAEPFRSRILKGLGDVHTDMGDFSKAQKYYEEAIALKMREGETRSVATSNMWLALASLYEKQNQSTKAQNNYYRAINALIIDRRIDDTSLPVLTNILAKKNLFTAMHRLEQLYLKQYGLQRQDSLLKKAHGLSRLSIALLDSTMNEVSLQQDKVILAEQSFSAYEDAIRIGYELYQTTGEQRYLEDCFALTDKSKGTVLLENLRMVNGFARLDPMWFERERALQSELGLMEQALYQAVITPGSDANQLNDLRSRFAALKHEYSILLRQIQLEAPDYYNLRFDHSVISTTALRNEVLKDDEGLITFFLGDSTFTIFGLSKATIHFTHAPVSGQVHQLVGACRRALLDPEVAAESFRENFAELHRILLQDCLTAFGPSVRSLTIVPDGVLGYLPFEVLPSPEGEGYLVDDYQVRYAYSATYLSEQNRKRANAARKFFGGFVSAGDEPQAGFNRLSGKLVYAQEEVGAIAGMIDQATIYNPARKTDFIEHAASYRLLHLAMHSELNNEDPMRSTMVFAGAGEDRELTAHELYNLKLEADLAVLSACNTGLGEVRRGEGIMSLSRAFSYAGVPAALISLWKVPDKATSKIMVRFYAHLKSGASKSEALQKAKTDFIRDYPAMDHPYYWSGFVLAGNNDPIPFPRSMWPYVVAGVALAGGLFLLMKRRKKRSGEHAAVDL